MFQLEVGINIQQVVLNLYIITGFKRDRDTGHKGTLLWHDGGSAGINKDDLFYNHTLLTTLSLKT